MRGVITYLLIWLSAIIAFWVAHFVVELPSWYSPIELFTKCALMGAVGGVLYCLRAVYLNKCVHKSWDKDWHTWYYLRPLTSTISGFVSCFFLKAGLLVLAAEGGPESAPYGYYTIAFIAGLNVDNFTKKLETIAESVWGISKSRASDGSDKNRSVDKQG